jgi:hypothetical protein
LSKRTAAEGATNVPHMGSFFRASGPGALGAEGAAERRSGPTAALVNKLARNPMTPRKTLIVKMAKIM